MSHDRHSSRPDGGPLYEHTAYAGWLAAALILPGIGMLIAAVLALQADDGSEVFSLAMLGVAGLALVGASALFYRMQVVVTHQQVRARFGRFAWPEKTVDVDRIVATRPIRNAWWHGWGIHAVGRRTVLYNVTGRRSLDLELDDGSHVRIGTSDPDELAQAIAAASASS